MNMIGQMFGKCILITGLFCLACGAGAVERFVSPSGAHTPPFTSWETAATNIQAAVDAGGNGDVITVADGTYLLTSQIAVQKGVVVRSVNGPEATVVDGRGVCRCMYVGTSNAVVSGFTLTNGYAANGAGVYLYGGAMVTNCVITGNREYNLYGGGVYIQAAGILKNSVIRGNRADYSGGGVNCSQGGEVVDCVITGNVIGRAWANGAGVGLWGGGVLRRCVISGNMTTNSGCGGGGVFLNTGARMEDCEVTGNSAVSGGGIVESGGIVSNCVIEGNTATNAAGAYISGGLMVQSTVIRNISSGYGGGGIVAGPGTVDGCVVRENQNSSANWGSVGGVYGYQNLVLRNSLVVGNTSLCTYGYGGVGFNGTAGSNGLVQNCTVVGNRGYTGGMTLGPLLGAAENCVIYGNTGTGAQNWVIQVSGSIFRFCCTTPLTGLPGAGNISGDPKFMDSTNGNYRLVSDSPCINTGTNQSWMMTSLDLDGAGRLQHGLVDRGAYESAYMVLLWQPVAGTDGGGVGDTFYIGQSEIWADEYIAFLNAVETAGGIVVTAGQVFGTAASNLYCVAKTADPESYIEYDTGRTLGQRFYAADEKKFCPAVHVTWFGAAAYCNWRSQQEGLTPVYNIAGGWTAALGNNGYRLPAETEWLKAAAWDKNRQCFYIYGAMTNHISGADANFLHSGDAFETNDVAVCPVNSYQGFSPYGLQDASGNAWEWCHGFYEAGGADEDADAHAARGGSWGNLKPDVKTVSRTGFKPGQALNSVGFRIMKRAE